MPPLVYSSRVLGPCDSLRMHCTGFRVSVKNQQFLRDLLLTLLLLYQFDHRLQICSLPRYKRPLVGQTQNGFQSHFCCSPPRPSNYFNRTSTLKYFKLPSVLVRKGYASILESRNGVYTYDGMGITLKDNKSLT